MRQFQLEVVTSHPRELGLISRGNCSGCGDIGTDVAPSAVVFLVSSILPVLCIHICLLPPLYNLSRWQTVILMSSMNKLWKCIKDSWLVDTFVHCHIMNVWCPCMKGLVAVKCAMIFAFWYESTFAVRVSASVLLGQCVRMLWSVHYCFIPHVMWYCIICKSCLMQSVVKWEECFAFLSSFIPVSVM